MKIIKNLKRVRILTGLDLFLLWRYKNNANFKK